MKKIALSLIVVAGLILSGCGGSGGSGGSVYVPVTDNNLPSSSYDELGYYGPDVKIGSTYAVGYWTSETSCEASYNGVITYAYGNAEYTIYANGDIVGSGVTTIDGMNYYSSSNGIWGANKDGSSYSTLIDNYIITNYITGQTASNCYSVYTEEYVNGVHIACDGIICKR